MDNNYRIAILTDTIRKSEEKLKVQKEFVVGIFVIKISGWDIHNFIPLLFLCKSSIYIYINDKYSKVAYSDIHEIEYDKKNSTVNLIIDKKNSIEFSLVNINGSLNIINQDYTQQMYNLLKDLVKEKRLNTNLLANLPNQKNLGLGSATLLQFVITSMLMITFSIFLGSINVALSWFLLFGGLITLLIGFIMMPFRNRNNLDGILRK